MSGATTGRLRRRALIDRAGGHWTDVDGLVADWRTAAGDKMRGEYLDAMAATNTRRFHTCSLG
jgi:hypothetical protein